MKKIYNSNLMLLKAWGARNENSQTQWQKDEQKIRDERRKKQKIEPVRKMKVINPEE